MPIPPRSELPVEYVKLLETWDRFHEEDFGRKPILPAATTPELLVQMAKRLDEALKSHSHTRAAPMIEPAVRPSIDACLAGTVTQPMEVPVHHHVHQDVDLQDHPELSEAFYDFEDRITGKDHSTERAMKRDIRGQLTRRKHWAKEYGLDLSLTDEEWLEL